MDWSDFFTAVALLLIFEGILPFLNPGRYRNILEMMKDISDSQLRTMGLIVMAVGAILLTFVRAGSGG